MSQPSSDSRELHAKDAEPHPEKRHREPPPEPEPVNPDPNATTQTIRGDGTHG